MQTGDIFNSDASSGEESTPASPSVPEQQQQPPKRRGRPPKSSQTDKPQQGISSDSGSDSEASMDPKESTKQEPKRKVSDSMEVQIGDIPKKRKVHIKTSVPSTNKDMHISQKKKKEIVTEVPKLAKPAQHQQLCRRVIPERIFPTYHLQPFKLFILSLCESCCKKTNERVTLVYPNGTQHMGVMMCQRCVERNLMLSKSV